MEIKLYMTPTCPWSLKLKEWLKKKKCMFQEMDVFEIDKFREEMIFKTGQMAVPVIDIDGKIVVGFHENLIEEAMGGKIGSVK